MSKRMVFSLFYRLATIGQAACATGLMGCIRLYQLLVSPFLAPCCRFYPSCSEYAVGALKTHGLWKGSCLSVKRLLRCHPYHPGGIDCIPRDKNQLS